MRILTRGSGEAVMFRDDVSITVVGAKRNHIRVDFNASTSMAVDPEEVYERIKPSGTTLPRQAGR